MRVIGSRKRQRCPVVRAVDSPFEGSGFKSLSLTLISGKIVVPCLNVKPRYANSESVSFLAVQIIRITVCSVCNVTSIYRKEKLSVDY